MLLDFFSPCGASREEAFVGEIDLEGCFSLKDWLEVHVMVEVIGGMVRREFVDISQKSPVD